MDEEKLITEGEEPKAEAPKTPEEDAWMVGMEGKYPDLKGDREAMFKASREGYDREHKLNKDNKDAYDKIYAAVDRSPEVASFINKLTNPEEGAEPEEAYAEFGEDLVKLLTGEIDNEAYRKAKKARMDEEAARKAAEDAKNEAIGKAFVDACEEVGANPEEMSAKIQKFYNGDDAKEFTATKDFFKAIINSLTYEDDMLAAEARGRNAQMTERNNRRSTSSDGMPRSNGTGASEKKFNPNSLAAMAEARRRMNN